MKNDILKFPKNIVEPIRIFLEKEIVKLKRTKSKCEENASGQVDRFDSQVKAKFMDKQIVQIRKALTMIKLGKYGICERCGKMIDTDRLAVKPDSTICIKCELEREA